MQIFEKDKLFKRLSFIEQFIPPLKNAHAALERAVESFEYILFVTKELEPEARHLDKNVEKLKENIEILNQSLERHGFKKEAE